MNELEATRAKLKCLEMVEGTILDWWTVVRDAGREDSRYDRPLLFSLPSSNYEFAIGTLEGKPVWKDSKVFAYGIPVTIKQGIGGRLILADGSRVDKEALSWNPPKPKTVMVELTVEDAKAYTVSLSAISASCPDGRLVSACRKALEELK